MAVLVATRQGQTIDLWRENGKGQEPAASRSTGGSRQINVRGTCVQVTSLATNPPSRGNMRANPLIQPILLLEKLGDQPILCKTSINEDTPFMAKLELRRLQARNHRRTAPFSPSSSSQNRLPKFAYMKPLPPSINATTADREVSTQGPCHSLLRPSTMTEWRKTFQIALSCFVLTPACGGPRHLAGIYPIWP